MSKSKTVNEAVRKYINALDLSKCAPRDRDYCRHIIGEVLRFEDPIPDIQYDIQELPTYYIFILIGWGQTIDDTLWYETFLHPKFRLKDFEPIIRSRTIPSPDNNGETQKILYIAKKNENVHLDEDHNVGRIERQKNVDLNPEIDFKDVHENDENDVYNILRKVLSFNENMPRIEVKIVPTKDHYNIILRGWNCEIDDVRWYNTFLSETRKDYQSVNATYTVTNPNNDKGPYKVVQVRKKKFSGAITRK